LCDTIKVGQVVVKINKKFFRPLEVNNLKGDASKIKTQLGWKPEYNFEKLVAEMIHGE